MTMLATIGRLIWVPIASLLSLFVGAAVILTLGLERITAYANGFDDPDMTLRSGLELMKNGLILAQAATIVPALLVVLIGEIARIRTVYFYVVAGGLAAVCVPVVARLTALGPADVPAVAVWQVFAVGGFIAGFVYWLLAGRTA
jgi:hypothetical protein